MDEQMHALTHAHTANKNCNSCLTLQQASSTKIIPQLSSNTPTYLESSTTSVSIYFLLRQTGIPSGEAILPLLFLSPFIMVSNLAGNNSPLGENSFFSEQTPFYIQGSKQEVTKVVSLQCNGRKKIRDIPTHLYPFALKKPKHHRVPSECKRVKRQSPGSTVG